MAEKLNSNFVLKYYQYSNLKGIISVRGGKQVLAFLLRPQEGALSKILLMHVSSKKKKLAVYCVKLRLDIALAYYCSFVDFDCFHCPHL